MLGIIWTIIIGFIAGLIARAVHPGDDKLGFIMTAVLGIAGAFLAKYAGQMIGFYKEGEHVGFLASVVGAIIVLVIYSLVAKGSSAGSNAGSNAAKGPDNGSGG